MERSISPTLTCHPHPALVGRPPDAAEKDPPNRLSMPVCICPSRSEPPRCASSARCLSRPSCRCDSTGLQAPLLSLARLNRTTFEG